MHSGKTVAALAILLITFIAALLSEGPVAAAESSSPAAPDTGPPGSTPACIEAFSAALSESGSSPDPEAAGSVTGYASVQLDDAIRACASFEDWVLTALEYPEILPEGDLLLPLTERCLDPEADLEASGPCQALAVTALRPDANLDDSATPGAALTESPTPTPGAAPPQTPTPTSLPSASADPLDGYEAQTVRVPRKLGIKVRGATKIRYFAIRGQTPDQLMEAAAKKSRRHCDHRNSLACVAQRWTTRASQRTSASSGRCTITGVSSTLKSTVFVPRWISEERVEPAMLEWWKQVLKKISKHEATHISIQKNALAKLRRQLRGKSCSSFLPAARRSDKQLAKAQARFDERDAEEPWPERP